MSLAKYLNPDDLIEMDPMDKWDAIRFLTTFLVKKNRLDRDAEDEIRDGIITREQSMSTGIGQGVAIPHCSSTHIEKPMLVFAVIRNGLDFDAIDGKPVFFILLLVLPKNKFQMHISTLADIAKAMNSDELRASLLACKTTSEMYKIISS